ncbi:MFS transporter [Candidatus Contubernalis alkalaceticus]|nr:MFS transporter [Candidatus Contubernalis alkalaceticus]UNC93787.1 MFS transporter [Candidatus Contubernalis alkalaceticus]
MDNAAVGFLVTLVFFGYALARYPSGVMADKWGCTKTIIIGSLAMAVSFLAVAFSRSFFIIALFTFLLGVSSGLYVTAGYTLAVLIGTKHRASLATAAFESFGMVAGIISPFLVSFFVLYLNWPWLFIVLGAALF